MKNFALASKLVQCAQKRKMPLIVLKMDFQEAFDSVSWSCILQLLRQRFWRSLGELDSEYLKNWTNSSNAKQVLGQGDSVKFFERKTLFLIYIIQR